MRRARPVAAVSAEAVLGAVGGGVLVLATSLSVARTLVIPRGRPRFMSGVDALLDLGYRKAGRMLGTYERRDRLFATEPFAILSVTIGLWLTSYVVGFGLLLWPSIGRFPSALREAGSSLFTLGFAAHPGAAPTVLDFLAGAVGLIIVALQIAYLPTLYSAFNRRETEVTLLAARAGRPAWGPELLARLTLARSLANAPSLFEQWERWAAEVAESHSSYPSLLRFRSPEPDLNWCTALLAVLDAAALYLAAAPDSAPFQARLCLQMGFTCFRQLGTAVGFGVERDPIPGTPTHLTYEDFLVGWDRIATFGFPSERTPEEAWPHFQGWRLNYEDVAYRLAYAIDAVPALWSGPRRTGDEPRRPRLVANRTPDDPSGLASPFRLGRDGDADGPR